MRKLTYLFFITLLISCSQDQVSDLEITSPESRRLIPVGGGGNDCDTDYVFAATDMLNAYSYNPTLPSNCYYTQTQNFSMLEVYSGSDYGCFDISSLRAIAENLADGYASIPPIGMDIVYYTDFLSCGSGCGYFIFIESVTYYYPTVCANGGGGGPVEAI